MVDSVGISVCVVGLGYVGLPLAEAFAKKLSVIGFDTNSQKIKKLKQDNSNERFLLTDDPRQIGKADFVIICVPTPVTESKEPDLTYVKSAAALVGQNMKKGAVVVLESTVYPGVTEEIIKPILERESRLKCGPDFSIGYSPERINPGDDEHTVDRLVKIVAGMDSRVTGLMAELYRKAVARVFEARDIKTAEAAKVIENIQRDLNIALMNELAIIFEKMGLSTKDVLEAAATKWNFHRYSPGLVGGHCIPVVPYYLVYRARELGYHSQVILSGRAINDHMPKHIVEMTIKALNNVGKPMKGSRILLLGLTYKENVDDTRESPAKDIIRELREYSAEVLVYEPLIKDIEKQVKDIGAKALPGLEGVSDIDCVILTVGHDVFKGITLSKLRSIMKDKPVLIDVRDFFNSKEAAEKGIYYRTL